MLRSSHMALALLLVPALLPAAAADEEARFALVESARIQLVSTDVVQRIVESGEGPVIIDSRGPAEYARGHVPGALNVPHKETWGRIEELRKFEEDRGIIYYCVKGGRAKISANGVLAEGFRKVGVMRGHFRAWESEGRPVER